MARQTVWGQKKIPNVGCGTTGKAVASDTGETWFESLWPDDSSSCVVYKRVETARIGPWRHSINCVKGMKEEEKEPNIHWISNPQPLDDEASALPLSCNCWQRLETEERSLEKDNPRFINRLACSQCLYSFDGVWIYRSSWPKFLVLDKSLWSSSSTKLPETASFRSLVTLSVSLECFKQQETFGYVERNGPV